VPFDDATPIAERGGAQMIGPQINVNLFWTIPVSDAAIEGLRSGKLNVFVWGGVDYRDVFGNDRHFTFRTVNGSAALLINRETRRRSSRIPSAIRRTEREAHEPSGAGAQFGAQVHCPRESSSHCGFMLSGGGSTAAPKGSMQNT
jgi:hypothetical protein